jgi:DNA-binding LacI/PurR family transcriptional regulator
VEHLAEIEAARLRRLPVVVVDADPGPEINSVRSDARAGAAAARHLVDLGHRRFAIMSFLREFEPPRWHAPGRPRAPEAAGMQIDQDKLAGYAEVLAGIGIATIDVPMVQAHPWDGDAARLLLEMAPEATAILSMSAMQGIAVIEEARRRGRVVPRDLSVAAYNDIPDAARADPPLTTIDTLLAEKGRIAARMLLDPGPVRRELVPSRLLVRESTAPPPCQSSRHADRSPP